MSERVGIPLNEDVVLAKALRAAGVEIGSAGGETFRLHAANHLLASPWLRAHDDRIRAEALAPVLALADEWLAADTDRKAFVVQCGDALRAAAGTPTHHTTEEES